MQPWLLFLFLSFGSSLIAQNFTYTYPTDFRNCVTDLVGVTNDGHIVYAGHSVFHNQTNKNFAWFEIYTETGEFLHRDILPGVFPVDTPVMQHFHPLPDGGFVLDFENRDCSNSLVEYANLKSYSINSEWEVYDQTIVAGTDSSPKFDSGILPDGTYFLSGQGIFHMIQPDVFPDLFLYLADLPISRGVPMPDSTLLLLNSENSAVRYDLATEEILYTQEFPDSINPYYMKLISFVDTTFALKTPNGYLIYQNQDSINFVPASYPGDLVVNGNGGFSILYANIESGEHRLEKYDAFGNMIDTHPFTTRADVVVNGAVVTQEAVFFGGKDSSDEVCDYNQTKTVQAALFYSDTIPELTRDIGVSEIVIPEPVGISIVVDLNTYRSYHFQDVEVTVTNYGEAPVEKFYIFTNGRDHGITIPNVLCSGLPRIQDFFQLDQALQPGESFTTVFSDFYIRVNINQPESIPEVKIWTSAPDGFLDDNLNNNTFCTSDYLTTKTVDLIVSDLRVSPNPASNYLYLENHEDFSTYRIYDIAGIQVDEGALLDGVVSLNQLSDGLYFLEVSGKENTRVTRFIRRK